MPHQEVHAVSLAMTFIRDDGGDVIVEFVNDIRRAIRSAIDINQDLQVALSVTTKVEKIDDLVSNNRFFVIGAKTDRISIVSGLGTVCRRSVFDDQRSALKVLVRRWSYDAPSPWNSGGLACPLALSPAHIPVEPHR